MDGIQSVFSTTDSVAGREFVNDIDDDNEAETEVRPEPTPLPDDQFKDQLAQVIPHLRAFGRSLSGRNASSEAIIPEKDMEIQTMILCEESKIASILVQDHFFYPAWRIGRIRDRFGFTAVIKPRRSALHENGDGNQASVRKGVDGLRHRFEHVQRGVVAADLGAEGGHDLWV